MPRVLVSGADGRIGRRLLPYLQARGHELHGFDLCSTESPRADVRNPEQLRDLLARLGPVDIVVHLAALAHRGTWRDRDHLRSVNVTGTAHLCQEAGDAGVRQFVLTSSMDVYAPRSFGEGPVAETAALGPATDYGHSKLDAEQEVERRKASFERVSILRVAPVYSEEILGDLRKRVLLFGPLGYRCAPDRPRHSLCHIENLLEAIALVIERQSEPSATLNVSDAAPASQSRILRYLRALGIGPRMTIAVPGVAARALTAAALTPPIPKAVGSQLLKAFGETRLDVSRLRSLGYRGEAGLGASELREECAAP